MLNTEHYRQRRTQFLSQLPLNSVAVFPAAKELTRSRDTEYVFRQNSDFWYLTGFNEPDAWLFLVKQADGSFDESIILRPKDKTAEIWQGRRLGVDAAVDVLGITSAKSIDDIDHELDVVLKNKTAIYWPIGEYDWADHLLHRTLASLRSQARLYKTPHQLCDSRIILHEMRLIKSPEEIEIMRQAATISVNAHKRAMRFAGENKHEYQLEAEILHEFAMSGARSAAYNTIVACGDNANILHYTENTDELKIGQLVLIDAGCELEGYAADITRTFPVNGVFSEPQAALYNVVLKAQSEALKLLKPGNTLKQATDKSIEVISQGLIDLGIFDCELQTVLDKKLYRQFYMHGLSHWLGLDVHDVGEYKVDDTERPLKPGMVLTVEPGIYIAEADGTVESSNIEADTQVVASKWQGIGIRIEDNIVITDDGYENLTHKAPKTIPEIEQLMSQGYINITE